METIELADGGLLLYDPDHIPAELADRYFAEIMTATPWVQRPGVFGRMQPRLTAYYGDPGLTYRYSGTVNDALPWTETLLEIKATIEKVMGKYNSCLINLYRSEADSVGLHADNEPEMGDVIGSVSLGATRDFIIRHNETREKQTYKLGHGSLLVMAGTMQKFWKHEVPKAKEEVGERINLTFRMTNPSAR